MKKGSESMSSLLLGVFFLCLYIYSGEKDVSVGYKILEYALLVLLVVAAVYAA